MARMTSTLDGLWCFQIDRDEQGEARGWHEPNLNPADWLQVNVPGNWDSFLPELFGYAGHAWYRRTFPAPFSARHAHSVYLRFEGANYETTVWVNGQQVGVHSGGFDPFEFDITELLNWDGENALAVRVDNWPKLGRVPNSYGGWWNYGGIYRSVKLVSVPDVRVEDVFVRAAPGEGQEPALLFVDVTIMNESSGPVELSVRGQVRDDATSGSRPAQDSPVAGDPGAVVALRGQLAAPAVVVGPGDASNLTLSAGLPVPKLWSPNSPSLYRLDVTLTRGGAAIDEREVTFGVRRFEVCGTQLFLNGDPIVLCGFNRHEEYAGTGRVDPGGGLEADLRLTKELNGNMVRMHYQAHPDLYDLADRMGLLVFAEIPLWGVGNRDATELTDPGVREVAERMLRTLIAELKNHPSVVIWSVGNECATNKPESRPLIGHLAQVARSLDSTRPVAYVGMFGPAEQCFDLVDLPGINVYFGKRLGELGGFVDKVHALTPDKPLLITEFGHEAVLGLRGEGYGSEDEQAYVLERKWEIFKERRAFVPGGLIWCLADYWHMPAAPEFRWMNRIYFCHGVTTLARQQKQATGVINRMWRDA